MKFIKRGLAVITAMILFLWLFFPMNIIVSNEQVRYDNFSAPLIFSRYQAKINIPQFRPKLAKSQTANFSVGSEKIQLRQHELEITNPVSIVESTFHEVTASAENPYDKWNHFAEKFTPIGMAIQGEAVIKESETKCTLFIHGLEKSAK